MTNAVPHAQQDPTTLESAVRATVAAAAAAADDVDAEARFPHEAVDAMKVGGLPSCAFPSRLGGLDTSIRELANISRRLGEACSAAGMIFAMHHSQAAAVAQSKSPSSERLIQAMTSADSLIASATTEISTGGDIRNSTCAVVTDGHSIVLEKNAPVISYGDYADYIAITARRNPDAPSSDQVLVVVPRRDVQMRATTPWNVIGFRGTCSPGFLLRAETATSDALQLDYGSVSERTVLPTAHILWSAVWLGIADAAMEKARREVRSATRKSGGETTPQASRFVDLIVVHQRFEAFLRDSILRYESFLASGQNEPPIPFTIALNNLKINSSMAVVDVVTAALAICGLNGYREDHPASMGRLLRDSFGPQLMVSNDRIRANTAQIVPAYRLGKNL